MADIFQGETLVWESTRLIAGDADNDAIWKLSPFALSSESGEIGTMPDGFHLGGIAYNTATRKAYALNSDLPPSIYELNLDNPSLSTKSGQDFPANVRPNLWTTRDIAYLNNQCYLITANFLEGGSRIWEFDPLAPQNTRTSWLLRNNIEFANGITQFGNNMYCLSAQSFNSPPRYTSNEEDNLWQINFRRRGQDRKMYALPDGLTTPSGLGTYRGNMYCFNLLDNSFWYLHPTNRASCRRIGPISGGLTHGGGGLQEIPA